MKSHIIRVNKKGIFGRTSSGKLNKFEKLTKLDRAIIKSKRRKK